MGWGRCHFMTAEFGGRVIATARYSAHAAADGQGAWIVSGLPRRLFSRNQAITVMVLAERLAVRARPAQVVPLAGGQVLGLLGRQRCEDVAELLHHAVVQQAGVADSGYPELGEFSEGRGLWDAEHVDRARAG